MTVEKEVIVKSHLSTSRGGGRCRTVILGKLGAETVHLQLTIFQPKSDQHVLKIQSALQQYRRRYWPIDGEEPV